MHDPPTAERSAGVGPDRLPRDSVRRRLHLVRVVAATAAQRVVAERSGLVVVGLFYLMVTSVLAGLWAVAADANDGVIVGYSAVALVWYIATTESVTISLPMRLIDDTGREIGSGQVTSELLRPTSMLGVRVATQIGACLPRLVVCCGLGAAFAWVVGGPPVRPATLPLAAVAVVLAVVVNVVAQHFFAGISFWLRHAGAAWFIYQKLVFILGGMLLPIEVLPPALESLARVLPFVAMAYVPGRLASGHLDASLLLVQVGWLIVGAVAVRRLYRRGERHLVETGA